MFLTVYSHNLSRRSRQLYTHAVKRCIADLPELFGSGEVVRWHQSLTNKPREWSAANANTTLAILRIVTRRGALVTGDHQLASFFAACPRLREPLPSQPIPPQDFVRRILPACRNQAEAAWLLLACLAGLRRGELMGLKPSDYDAKTQTLYVTRQRGESCRKNRRPHVVVIDDPQLRDALDWAIAHKQGKSAGGWLFAWSHRYEEAWLRRLRHYLGDDAALYLPPGAGWHQCRRWGATQLARHGASHYEVQAWLGDGSPGMACRYVEEVRGKTRGSTNRLGQIAREE